MKLFSLRLTTLKSKLYAIVFASFVARVVAFFVLPNTPSSLGPDEGTYGQLAEWTALSKPANDFPDFGGVLYRSSRAFIWPAAMLCRLGLDQIDAVRVTASGYGLLTLLIVAHTLLKSNSENSQVAKFIASNQKVIVLLFIIYSLLPSHFVWSVLGLRESATEFWVVTTFASVYWTLNLQTKIYPAPIMMAFVGVVSVFSVRPQVGWVLGISILIYCLIQLGRKEYRALFVATVTGVVLGYLATTAFVIETTENFTARAVITEPNPRSSLSVPPSPNSKATPNPSRSKPATSSPVESSSPLSTSRAEFNASRLCATEGQTVIVEEISYSCSNRVTKKSITGIKNPGKAVVEEIDEVPLHHNLNKVGAASVIRTTSCPNSGDSRLDQYFCLTYRAPYTTSIFLFRPIFGPDVTSSSSLFAATENLFWLGAIIFAALMFVRNHRLAFFGPLAPSLLFMSIYVVGAGAYEGNMGTAFRHKSLILWAVLLLIASTIVATQQRKAEQQGISGSSQE